MNDIKIDELPVAGQITGTEQIPLVQNGVTMQATASDLREPSYYQLSYGELVQKIANGQLKPGAKYQINDYATVYIQPKSGELMSGPVEPLVVTAAQVDSLEGKAFSPGMPKDEIWYDINNDDNNYSWAHSSGKGIIYRRVDAKGNDLPYDFRAVKFRRWAVNYDAIEQWTTGQTCYWGDVRRNAGTANNIVYLCVNSEGTTVNPTTYGSADWVTLLRTKANNQQLYLLNNSDGLIWESPETPIWDTSNLPVNGYLDCYTFHGVNDNSNRVNMITVSGNRIDCSDTYSTNGKAYLPNTVIFDATSSNSMRICDNFLAGDVLDNTVVLSDSEGFVGNNFIAGFKGNIINSGAFHHNTGDRFNFNVVGIYSRENTFTHIVQGNFFGDNIIFNCLNGDIKYNIFNNNFNYNYLRDVASGNVIAPNCSNNDIGQMFASNFIGTVFSNNVIGTGCSNNNIKNNFSNNFTAPSFQGNNIGNSCMGNRFGNVFRGNSLGDNVQYITFMEGLNLGADMSGSGLISTGLPMVVRRSTGNHYVADFYDVSSGINLQSSVIY